MNQRLTDLRRAQLDQLLSGGTNMAGGGLLKAAAKAAKPAAKAAESALQLGLGIKKGLGWAGSKTPDTSKLAKNAKKFIYHSDIAPNVNELHHGIEPQQGGPWVREVAHGAVDNVDEFLENTTPLAWFSDDPTWVKMKVSRHLNKSLSELTEDDIRKYGHLAIINKKDPSLENIWRVGEEGLSNGEYSKVQTLKGESIPAYQTDLYQNDYQGNKEPFGVERDEWVSTQPVEPFVQLTGDDLIDFLKKSGNFKSGGEVHLAGGGDPRKRGLFPKMPMQAIVNSPGFDPTVPDAFGNAYQRRIAEKEKYERETKDQKLTPANRAVAGLEAAGMIGSALFEGVQQLPKLLDGEEAYTKAVGEGMYQPRFQPEKAAEYAGNVGDFLEKLETDYKIPPIVPELIPFIGAAEAAKQQSKRAVKQGALTAASRMDAGPKAGSMAAQRGVIKMPGGNWRSGSVESQLKDLKSKGSTEADREWLINHAKQNPVVAQMGLDSIPKNEAINKWVESNLTNYVKKQMATPDDPVRKLAEQGIVHMPNRNTAAWNYEVSRKRAGYPIEGFGVSPEAKSWEQLADSLVYTDKAKSLIDPDQITDLVPHLRNDQAYLNLQQNPWLSKVDPETNIYSLGGSGLGFDHIVDVLKQDLAEGRIRPEQLNKVSMEQAVRRAYEYDQEMAKKMRETQAKVTEGMPIHKEYPEGYKWIELTKPKDLPSGYKVSQDKVTQSYQVLDKNGQPLSRMEFDTPDEAVSFFNSNHDKRLEEALKYEGDTMGHCVGGYCPEVAEGRSRIYSLRDAKGEPHVTVEVKPHANYEEAARILETDDPTSGDIARLVAEGKLPGTQRITQIKGKGNRAPKEEYLPFVQDFVKGGNWSDVGDFRNTGLIRKSDLIDKFSSDELDAIGSGEYLTKAEHDDLLLKALRPPEEGMAGGGSVGLRNALNNLLRTDKPEVHMGLGGSAAKAAAKKAAAKAAEAAKVAGKAAEYLPGVHYADPIKPPTMKMSEALGNAGAEGKTLNFTETDRSRVFGPNRGGTGFSGLQHYSLPHKEANTVWGFGNKTTAEKKIRQNDPENTIWTTYAGSPNQHKSNTIVVKDALSQLQSANSQGLVNSKQIEFINDRIRSSVGQNGNPLFPSNFDITDPKAFDYATTFDRRAAINDALMGIGVKKPMISKEFKAANPGVKWSDAANIDAILRRETDPAMLDANTFDVGPHLFTMDNGVIERPDLNEAFPYQVTGTDLGLRYKLAPMRAAAPDWIKARNIKPNEPINAWAMSRAAPSQFVSEAYLTSLQKQGKKKGGLAQIKKVKRHGNTVPH